MTELTISASEIGAVLGCFTRRCQYAAIVKLWKKTKLGITHQPNEFLQFYQNRQYLLKSLNVENAWNAIYSKLSIVTTQEQIESVLQRGLQCLLNNEVMREHIRNAMSYVNSSLMKQDHLKQYITDLLTNHIKHNQHFFETISDLDDNATSYNLWGLRPVIDVFKACSELLKSLTSATNCAYGRNGEQLYVSAYNESMDAAMVQPRDTQRRKSPHSTHDGRDWHIDGRVDGYHPNKQLVEIKHRVGVGFHRIPVYELIQIHAYMFILDRSHIKLIQCIRRAAGTVEDTTIVFYNDDFWQTIMRKITVVFNFIETLSSQPVGQDCFFLLPEDKKCALLEKHFPSLPEISEEEYKQFIDPTK